MQRADLFFGHGTATAFDEACWMLSHALDLSPDFDDAMLAGALEPAQAERLDRLLRRRIETRRPLAYLIGEAWFAGLRFRVDENTLVPRSPLAELVVGGLQPWLDLDRPMHVLDVGTGCGCIAAALAWHWPELRVDATDISPAALAIAEENVARLGLAERVRLIESDVYAGLGGADAGVPRYDLIVSNPPYVPEPLWRCYPRNIGTSRRWRCAPAKTAWISCAGCWLARRSISILRDSCCWKSARPSRRPRRSWAIPRPSGWSSSTAARAWCCWIAPACIELRDRDVAGR